ncbi:G2/M phase-specific E3 ubiquitin-protein ligase-like [Xyrauchen texanus]|uniref:G2/M phase-specific E3 ubiquitin-protein ligase-like n=1 Tax=Xyrauchen texanus TaxID=154827 RepID=UPI002242373C|nr:G2/M phase-specific E3 ubiquitin-protein ligase-like [Xyrauchen texanus]
MTSFDLDIFQEEELEIKLEKVVRCGTNEELEELKCTLGDWIADCGVPNIYTASLRDLPTIHGQIVTHYLYHRVASMVQQFIAGMNSCGQMWEMVAMNWREFLPLFTNAQEKLSRNDIRNLFTISWSPQGSNHREQEEETVFHWECWLMSIQEEDMDISFEDLLVFVTGADSVPPLGFPHKCQLDFYNQEDGSCRIPYSSTCSLCLFLPRGVTEEEEFKRLMFLALKGSLGFGKV